MLFNSSEYLIFLCLVLVFFSFVRTRVRTRNLLLLTASYVFYGWWSLGFLGLMIASSCVDYYLGRGIAALTERRKAALLISSLVVNLGALLFFKYRVFIWESASNLVEAFGYAPLGRIQVGFLPVGISFYTFQSISFIIDVYRGTLQPPTRLTDYLAYVAFFPQLVAGPIERSGHLLPQFSNALPITAAHWHEGIWLIIWGLFKKVVIADGLAPMVEMVYGQAGFATGPTVILSTFAFGIQIYCDFSGYSDVARGSGKLFGFDIMFNFRIPYGSRDIREFWNRWHISLSTWFRDYVYVPLGGNREGFVRTMLNLTLVMLLAGIWHGAAVSFVLWGLVHALALVGHRVWLAIKPAGISIPAPIGWVMTMAVVFSSWVFFRASSTQDLYFLLSSLGTWKSPAWILTYAWGIAAYGGVLVALEALLWVKGDMLAPIALRPWPRALLQSVLIIMLALSWQQEKQPFIYFQF